MCKPGGPDQVYQEKNKQIQQNAMKEVQVNKTDHVAVPLMTQKQEVIQQQPTPYASFLQHLTPLPSVQVADGQAQEEKVGWKEKKRRKEMYKEQYKDKEKALKGAKNFLKEADLKSLDMFKTKQGREQWENEKLPHSEMTRGQTVRMIMDKGDYSNFENLDGVMRNIIAGKALQKFDRDFVIHKGDVDSQVNEIIQYMKETKEGVSGFLDPALRLGFSLAQKMKDIPKWKQEIYLKLDEAMSTAVMEATLTHVPDQQKVKDYYSGKGSKDPQGDTQKAISANKAQQIQIAKRLLLMQLSNFQKITKNDNGRLTGTAWDKSMAVALSHCSRVVLTLPRQDDWASNAEQQKRMWRAIYTINGNNDAQDNSRASSTHSIARRKVGGGGLVLSKEKKLPFNFIGQRGMNCAIGGLGNSGISGKTLSNDGSCGHFYSMYKEADADNYGAMLMGLESDAAGVMNQMGHTHDIHATAEKASSLGGQRTDEIGEKYGGRQCDLITMSAESIAGWMEALERSMLGWQGQPEGMATADASQVVKLLAGKKMSAADWTVMKQKLGLPDAFPTPRT